MMLTNLIIVALIVDGFYQSKCFHLYDTMRHYMKFKMCLRQNDRSIEVNESVGPYIRALIETERDVKYRFFFPSHNGGKHIPQSFRSMFSKDILTYDMPELDGLDNIHNPEGPLKASLELAAKVFGSDKSWYLVNGSTSGILASILLCIKLHQMKQPTGRRVFMITRDSHKSVINGITLSGDCNALILPVSVDKDFKVSLSLDVEVVKEAINKYGSEICGLMLTRPTYQGLILDNNALTTIINICHLHNIPVIIDEAHGSHLKFLSYCGIQDGLSCGADIVVQSTHKTLFAFSQCAMMHLNHGAFNYDKRIDIDISGLLHDIFSSLTSTSPNSLFLASLDATTALMATDEGKSLVRASALYAEKMREYLKSQYPVSSCRLLDDSDDVKSKNLQFDPLRLSLQFQGSNSIVIDDIMCEEDGIYCELNQPSCITYNIPIGVSEECVQFLADSILSRSKEKPLKQSISSFSLINDEISYVELSSKNHYRHETVSLVDELTNSMNTELIGRLCAETICPYPPGIPITVKGETLSESLLQKLIDLSVALNSPDNQYLGSGCSLTGCADSSLRTIRVFVKR